MAVNIEALDAKQLALVKSVLVTFNQRFQAVVKNLDDNRSFWSSSPPTDVDASRLAVDQDFQTLDEIVQAGAVGGRAVTDADVRATMSRLSLDVKAYAGALDQWNAGSPTAWLAKAAKTALALGGEITDFITAPIRGVKTILIWGTVAVAAIFLLPPILRTVTAYRRGGADEALDEATRRLEAGQESIRSGARRAASLTAKGAAAYASGNPALLMSGLRRHRRSHR